MAVFTTPMPRRTGNPEADISSLYNWAETLVTELRSMLYTLDRANVLSAQQADRVNVSGITGQLREEQLPESYTHIDISDGELALTASDGTQVAVIYCDSDNNLNIKTPMGKVLINDVEIP